MQYLSIHSVRKKFPPYRYWQLISRKAHLLFTSLFQMVFKALVASKETFQKVPDTLQPALLTHLTYYQARGNLSPLHFNQFLQTDVAHGGLFSFSGARKSRLKRVSYCSYLLPASLHLQLPTKLNIGIILIHTVSICEIRVTKIRNFPLSQLASLISTINVQQGQYGKTRISFSFHTIFKATSASVFILSAPTQDKQYDL